MKSATYNPLGPGHFAFSSYQNGSRERSPVCVGVFFATREGHTRQIADRIAAGLRKDGFDVDVQDVRRPLMFNLNRYAAAVLAASVHEGNHENEMVQFVKNHREALKHLPTAFISVTLSQAGVERPGATPAERDQFATDVDKVINRFFEETRWHPTFVKPVAGALLYTKYNFFIRFIMKRIAKKAGAATDTSRDYDYTDWADLDRFVEEFATDIRSAAPSGRVLQMVSGRASA